MMGAQGEHVTDIAGLNSEVAEFLLHFLHGPGALLDGRTASWHSLADVNTLSMAGSERSFASSGSETRLEYEQ